jgi:hypothetical protein
MFRAKCFGWKAVATTLCAIGMSSGAFAQVTPPPVNSVTDLADAIAGLFGKKYGNGTVGNDWCYNVETERGYSYWYYKAGADTLPLTATQVTRTARIQATYTDSNNGNVITYASVFLGVVANPPLPQSISFDLNVTMPKGQLTSKPSFVESESAKKYRAALASPGLQFPTTNSTCMDLAHFLVAYFLPNDLQVQPNTVVTLDQGSFGEVYDTAVRWWMFSGRGHAVFNISTYQLKVAYKLNGITQTTNATLVVGFGGGAGP